MHKDLQATDVSKSQERYVNLRWFALNENSNNSFFPHLRFRVFVQICFVLFS